MNFTLMIQSGGYVTLFLINQRRERGFINTILSFDVLGFLLASDLQGSTEIVISFSAVYLFAHL